MTARRRVGDVDLDDIGDPVLRCVLFEINTSNDSEQQQAVTSVTSSNNRQAENALAARREGKVRKSRSMRPTGAMSANNAVKVIKASIRASTQDAKHHVPALVRGVMARSSAVTLLF